MTLWNQSGAGKASRDRENSQVYVQLLLYTRTYGEDGYRYPNKNTILKKVETPFILNDMMLLA